MQPEGARLERAIELDQAIVVLVVETDVFIACFGSGLLL